MMLRVTGEPDFPVRIVSLRRLQDLTPAELIARALELRAASTDRLRLGMVKIVVDGSIQGFSARLRWPGYYNGAPNGLWYVDARGARAALRARARAGRPGPHAHQRRRGDRAGARLPGGGAREASRRATTASPSSTASLRPPRSSGA